MSESYRDPFQVKKINWENIVVFYHKLKIISVSDEKEENFR